MKVEKRDASQERKVLIGMITDAGVVSSVNGKWSENGLFRNVWSNLIGSWCLSFFKSYGKAPGKDIQTLFESFASEEGKDKETLALIEQFLSSLSEEYESAESNSEYLVDLAAKHFKGVALEKHIDKMRGFVDSGQVDKAYEIHTKFKKVSIGQGAWVDILQDKSATKKVFTDPQDNLITYPGSLGKFFGHSLQRNSFIAFFAPIKRGKTFWLLDMAWRAMLQRKRVAFFQTGDLTEPQVIRRLLTRAARRPFYDGAIRLPLTITKDVDKPAAEITYKEKIYKDRMTYKMAKKAFEDTVTNKVRSRESYFKLSVRPSHTLSALGILTELQSLESAGWVPDVVLIDYADLLAPSSKGFDRRDQTNETWSILNSIRQTLHCLMVTATQSNKASFTMHTLDETTYSEDLRKLAHVTGAIGINQIRKEKESDITRLNWIVLREEASTVDRCVDCAGCRSICNPAVVSTF